MVIHGPSLLLLLMSLQMMPRGSSSSINESTSMPDVYLCEASCFQFQFLTPGVCKREKPELMQLYCYPWLIVWKAISILWRICTQRPWSYCPPEREQKRVQGRRWLILKRNWMCTKLSAILRVLSSQRDILLLQSQSTKVAAGIRRSYCEGITRVVWNACILKSWRKVEIQKANHGDEARALLTKLPATSKQVLGHQHNTTKEVALLLEKLISPIMADVHYHNIILLLFVDLVCMGIWLCNNYFHRPFSCEFTRTILYWRNKMAHNII